MKQRGAAPDVTVVQRCDRFVARTMNWLYDHLRCVPRHVSLVLSDRLANRNEFPLLEARSRDPERVSRRLWRRFMDDRVYPAEAMWLRLRRPAILHSHFGYVAMGDLGLRAFLGVPWIVSFYGADVYELGRLDLWRDRYARLFAQADLVLALGPQMAAHLQLLGCPKGKIAVHPLGVDVEALPSRPRLVRRGDTLHILFAGAFREKKGVEYVIRGVAGARQRGVRLHLTLVGDAGGKAGDVRTKESIFRAIQELKLNDAVTHRPFVPFAELIRIALASHVFVAPSVTGSDGDAEGTPFVLQQMMATEMPVIATRHSDIPFVFGNHQDRLVPERDSDAITARLQEYADEPERLVLDGRVLRERIRAAFDVRACAARLSDIYDALRANGPWRPSHGDFNA